MPCYPTDPYKLKYLRLLIVAYFYELVNSTRESSRTLALNI